MSGRAGVGFADFPDVFSLFNWPRVLSLLGCSVFLFRFFGVPHQIHNSKIAFRSSSRGGSFTSYRDTRIKHPFQAGKKCQGEVSWRVRF